MKCFMTNQDCIFEREIQGAKDNRKDDKQGLETVDVFVVSPFGYPYDEVYERIIRPSVESTGRKPGRADRAFRLGFVMCQKICKLIQEAEYVIADVTEHNPNVYYELGLAWGFGKKILLIRDDDCEDSLEFMNVWQSYKDKLVPYADFLQLEELIDPRTRLPRPELGDRFGNLMQQRTVDTGKLFNMDEKRKPSAYISDKHISFCYRGNLADAKFYIPEIAVAAQEADTAAPWTVNPHPISPDLLDITNPLPKTLISSKIWIVDVTHYDCRPDPVTYFVLGLAHSLGRETIPITNKAKSSDSSPFDVRGLWQIYFEDLKTLGGELKSIMGVIDKTYQDEMADYPLRYVWDQILQPRGKLLVLTCARAARIDGNRPGGRTNVDKWDYTSVAELTAFMAKKYRHAEIIIEAPEEKNLMRNGEKGKNDLVSKIEDRLKISADSVMIIGSPDVSDYTEVALARAYGIEPYSKQPCHQNGEKQQRCWDPKCKHDDSCLSQRGYMFYKETRETTEGPHPRDFSSFFRNPPKDTRDCVVWYGKQFDCGHDNLGERAEGRTFGVLTIMKNKNSDRWLIVLSGFTGIGTYALAKLLTKGNALFDALSKRNLETEGAQLLVSINYESESGEQAGNVDTRRPKSDESYTILDVQPMFPHAVRTRPGAIQQDGSV